jgi:hypothetical protein
VLLIQKEKKTKKLSERFKKKRKGGEKNILHLYSFKWILLFSKILTSLSFIGRNYEYI